MTQKELRKLGKPELIDRILEQDNVIERLQVRVEQLEEQLNDRSIKVDQAGNLAEAALEINGVFEAAQKAAQQYLKNVETLNERTESLCAQKEADCEKRCKKLEAQTKQKCEDLEAQTKQKCEDLEKNTELKVNAKWNEFSKKVDQCLAAHGELKEILKAAAVSGENV